MADFYNQLKLIVPGFRRIHLISVWRHANWQKGAASFSSATRCSPDEAADGFSAMALAFGFLLEISRLSYMGTTRF